MKNNKRIRNYLKSDLERVYELFDTNEINGYVISLSYVDNKSKTDKVLFELTGKLNPTLNGLYTGIRSLENTVDDDSGTKH